ncbi:2-polyprenyl-6-methoxyphenol hydroxylase-like FAD-dependent oxidoreductase [Pseudonocardia hierapolitana]|uniref:2-polyprenyl-6-methoxyphenol hydroxylase-like FAD-dependent oxidoreductase n=1 Tax=Pseudonocardia hierapolitana TaxID=1128676 RepID=A0A561SQU0_9PSEU|nr:FAD-dependent oxidoreductase [Pseudonocardia hierapolitana]TWF77227.1 2-polyprenyl-6-methoxyphenol hydroxylase-like FAD-dependent oxidoreductase [Pseudonocardia hierapolitana]
MRRLETEVLVVGGGPVGLTLAMDLARRGVDVTVAEVRRRGEPPSVKCNHVSARSMEIFRRLGVAGAVRDAGLPPDYPNDVVFRTTATGIELARIPIPSRAERFTATGGPDTWWPTPEPPHRINQIYLEPILHEHAVAAPGLVALNRTRVSGFTQSDRAVVARAEDLDTGEHVEITCAYLVGCDGGRSGVRRRIGARLHGDPVVQRVQSTVVRAPGLLKLMPAPAWANFSLNPRRTGNMYAIDGRETWLIHNYLTPSETDFDAVDRDACIRLILGVGSTFEYEVTGTEDWIGRRLVADRLREGKVFLCGDAAHIWVPMAGYGMNAGIADATNLSWLLAAVLGGWAPESILDAYEAERLPITDQVSRFAMDHAIALSAQRDAVPDDIEAPGRAGDLVRAQVGTAAYALNVNQYCCGGLNFGYFYDDSPIIAYGGAAAPAYTMSGFTPSTVPGCRLPHLWLPDGRSLFDALGPYYTLLRRNRSVEVGHLVAAASMRGVPLAVLDLDAEASEELAPRALVLARPDQHVAWRGDRVPAEPLRLVDLIRGASL